ncbi:MAG: Pvc16 family protein [Leptolyngbya sp.]|nr:Pvc16 family protein [Leptolyngbya sp.]
MISAIAQAVANLLASGPTLTGTEQIDFGYPGQISHELKPCLHLYHYEIQSAQSPYPQPSLCPLDVDMGSQPIWFDVVFALMACDHTALGEQTLLSESLSLLLQSPHLPHRFLSPSLRRYPALPLRVAPITLLSQPAFWLTLGIPLRPALQIAVTAPFEIPLGDRLRVNDLPLPHAPP